MSARKPKQRQWSRMNLDTWAAATSPHLIWDADHHKLLIETLKRVTAGECSRLMIFMPPRHGKSETVTIHYAAWRLERDPKMNIIIGSYNQKLANRFSRKIREIERAHKVALSTDRQAAEEWETTEGGGVRAVGVGAGITGFGADLVIIDDPVRSRADAESETFRDRTHEWFTDDIYTRLTPNGQVVVIQTRWHEDDLAGRLLKAKLTGEGDEWEELRLPAFAGVDDPLSRTEGAALWPARFSAERLEQIRRMQGHYSFEALYQQNPVLKSGDQFKREWFTHFVDEAPKGLTWVRAYDLAISEKTTADYTASFRVAKHREGNFYIDGGYRKRVDFPTQQRFVLDRVRRERDTVHYIEDAIHGRALHQSLRRELGADSPRLKTAPVVADKVTRALPWQAYAEAGKVTLVRGTWNDDFIDECCSFPKGRHDDQVDAVSLAFNVIEGRNGKGFHAFD
jgi:predicted phage terminase large subunit-like protein